jgi:hypothetical protein
MKKIIEMVTEKVFHDVITQTICEALILQQRTDLARVEAKTLDELHAACSNTKAYGMEEGVKALCNVLWRVFGGMPMHINQTIQKIVSENTSPYLGHDSKDYISIFATALEEVSK